MQELELDKVFCSPILLIRVLSEKQTIDSRLVLVGSVFEAVKRTSALMFRETKAMSRHSKNPWLRKERC